MIYQSNLLDDQRDKHRIVQTSDGINVLVTNVGVEQMKDRKTIGWDKHRNDGTNVGLDIYSMG